MSEEGKLKLIKVVIGLVGVIVVVVVLGFYSKSLTPSVLEEQTEAVHGMTGEEIEALLDTYRVGDASNEVTEESEEANLIDFEALQALNPHVYAWISIPGTDIEYPVLQHDYDDTYYLNYNIDGTYGYPGCIYTESVNSMDFQDNNTVLYGHNMNDGTMFAGLHAFEDGTFFEENKTVYIYTPEEVLTYEIFAAYVYDDRHIMYSFDFTDGDEYAEYIASIFQRRSMSDNLDASVEVTSEDKIITLATCISDQPNNRYLVQAVLLD